LNNRRIARHAARTLEAKVAAKVCPALTSANTVAAIISLARSDRRLASRIEDWDRDLWLLNTPLGVVDLTTGELRGHRPTDYMTKLTGAGPASVVSDCAQWGRFLARIFADDEELIAFIQRACGYSLTGSIAEQVLFFLYGSGANGKSVFVNVMRAVLGDYSTSVPMDALTVTHFQQHPTELTDLQGARFASAIETESGRRWAEARIKALTGGDKIKARRMRQDFFEFDPTHKLWIAGNHRPRLTDVDHAIKRRFLMNPFKVEIPKPEQDQGLANKIIAAELPAVLAWMIKGCLDWQKSGLAAPAKVSDATEEYLTSQDSLAQWIDDRCVKDVNLFTVYKDLFADWKQYAEQAHEYVGTQRALMSRLGERGYERDRNTAGTARGFHGIGLLSPLKSDLPSGEER
jgi:putative DNA primase/helicase